jgi:hypothetical protein
MKTVHKLFFAIIILSMALVTVSFIAIKKADKVAVQPDSPVSGALYNEIAGLDSLMFNDFNAKNLEGLKKYFEPSLELYQDNAGIRDYHETMEAFGALFKQSYVLSRKLVPGSMEVYPIKGYGAIETGRHRFSHIEGGKPISATFKFMNIWHQKNGKWRIARLITYDHPEDWK